MLPAADVVGGSHMVVNTLVAGGYDLVAEQVVCFDGHVHNAWMKKMILNVYSYRDERHMYYFIWLSF